MIGENREIALSIAEAIESLRNCRAQLVSWALCPHDIPRAERKGIEIEANLISIINPLLAGIGGVVIPFLSENTANPPTTVRLVEWYGYDQNEPSKDIWRGHPVGENSIHSPSEIGRFSLDALQTIADIRGRYGNCSEPLFDSSSPSIMSLS
ncbi:MAG: hypothetical protein WBO35_01955 [Candidatus Saccharimonadales bacterium]